MKTDLTKDDIPKHAPAVVDLGDGHYLKINCPYDEHMGEPWKEGDGHGPVSGWTRRDKRAGERILSSDHGANRYYDFAGAVEIAKRDGWGLAEKELTDLTRKLGRAPSKKQIASAAAERDFQLLQDWCDDGWHWIFVDVVLHDPDDVEISRDSLGGVEDYTDYWRECAAEMGTCLIEAHLEEVAESAHWAARDVMTGAPVLAN